MSRIVRWFAGVVMKAAQALPERRALALGRTLGRWSRHLVPARWDLVRRQLRLAYRDEKSPQELSRIARSNFAHYGQCMVEFLRIPLLNAGNLDALVTFGGQANLDAAKAAGRGVIVICGHYGNWDLVAVAQALSGRGAHIITKEAGHEALNELWMEVRRSKGVSFLPSSESAFAMLRVLKRGGTLGMALDQHRPGAMGVWPTFFGRPASTMRVAAMLALRVGCVVLPYNAWRTPEDKHAVVFGPAIPLVRGASDEETIHRTTQAYNDVLEGYVREHPEQWLWIHRRWKRRRTALEPHEIESARGPAPASAGRPGPG